MGNDTRTCPQQPVESSADSASCTNSPNVPTAICYGAGIAEAIKRTGLAFVLVASSCTVAPDPWAAVHTDNSTHLSAPLEKKRKRSLGEARKHALQVLLQAERERGELAVKEAQATAIWEDHVS